MQQLIVLTAINQLQHSEADSSRWLRCVFYGCI